MTDDTAHVAQQIADDMLTVAKALGSWCPAIIIPATLVKGLMDIGFDVYFREAAIKATQQAAAQTSGNAAAEAQAATTALERAKREASICRPCLEGFAVLVDEAKAAK